MSSTAEKLDKYESGATLKSKDDPFGLRITGVMPVTFTEDWISKTYRINSINTEEAAMTPMRQLAIAIVMAAMGACATPPEYQAADSYGYGYSERQLSNDQYRIHFRSRGDDTSQAMDYAMLRASELTLEKGFDWFDVASRETLLDHESVTVTHPAVYGTPADCELVACRESRRPIAKYQNTLLLGDERREVEVIMEIRMGNGLRPDSVASYDAREVNAYLQDDNPDA